MSTRAMARLALLACVTAWMPAAAYANEGAHAVAERFASEPERSAQARGAKAEDAAQARGRAEGRQGQEGGGRPPRCRGAESRQGEGRQGAPGQGAHAGARAPDRRAGQGRRRRDAGPRASREAEEMQAAEEARILAEQAAAMQRARSELQASQAAEQERAKPDAQRREATRGKEADTARAERERAKLEELAREAAGAQQAEATARVAEERAKAEALGREGERVKQAEAARAAEERAKAEALVREAEERVKQAEARTRAEAATRAQAEVERLSKIEAERLAQAEADRLGVEWTRRAVANRQAIQKLGRMRDIREARLAAQAQRAETAQRAQLAEARRKAEDEQRAAAPENRRPDWPRRRGPSVWSAPWARPGRPPRRARSMLRELRLPSRRREPDRSEPRTPDTQQRASRERRCCRIGRSTAASRARRRRHGPAGDGAGQLRHPPQRTQGGRSDHVHGGGMLRQHGAWHARPLPARPQGNGCRQHPRRACRRLPAELWAASSAASISTSARATCSRSTAHPQA